MCRNIKPLFNFDPPVTEDEVRAAVRVLRSRSLFRYYGIDLQKETESFEELEAEF